MAPPAATTGSTATTPGLAGSGYRPGWRRSARRTRTDSNGTHDASPVTLAPHSNASAARSGPRGSQVPQRPGPLLCVSIRGTRLKLRTFPNVPAVCTSDAHRLAQLRTRPSFSTPRTGGRNSASSSVTPWPARSSSSSASISATVASASVTREASTTTQCCGRLLAHAGSNSILEPVSVREEQQPVDSHEDLVRRDEISMTDPTVGGRGGRDHHGLALPGRSAPRTE